MPTERTMQDDPNAPAKEGERAVEASVAEAVALERAPERNVNTRTRPSQGGKGRGRKKHGAGRAATRSARPTGSKKASRTTGAKTGGGRKRATPKKGPKKRTAATKRGARGKTRPGSGKTDKRRAKGSR
jgi:hypothetical protein